MVLCVDDGGGVVGRWTHVLTIVDKTKENIYLPTTSLCLICTAGQCHLCTFLYNIWLD